MASIHTRKTDTGAARYDVCYREGGKQRRETFERLADARRRKAEVETELVRGTYIDSRNPTTVAAYAREWVEARPHRPSTRVRELSLVANHIEGTPLGGRRLVDVRATEVQAWASGRAAVLAPSTARLAVRFIRSVFAAAVEDRLIPSSPASRVTVPQPPKAKVVPLTVGQVAALTEQMPPRNRAMVIAQAGLGLRVAELFALRVSDVDFLRRTVHVGGQMLHGQREQTKTGGVRDVPLPRVVADALAQHLATYPATGDALLFTSGRGTAYRHNAYGETFTAAAERAGLPKGTTSHDLRHAYASWLLSAGESVVVVAERLGHASPALVLSTYGHLMPDTEDRTRQAVDAAWERSSVAPSAVRVAP